MNEPAPIQAAAQGWQQNHAMNGYGPQLGLANTARQQTAQEHVAAQIAYHRSRLEALERVASNMEATPIAKMPADELRGVFGF